MFELYACKICSIGIAYSIEGHSWRIYKCGVLAGVVF